ncbi:Uncharacterised protein family (UPF0158) [Pseudomonas cuatrocienegasensis]|uniref:Uncharacterized protein n=1 Tax=Pseudomonas cuatrocienegasensis TaxID=543360 RepID=A0ABY1B6T8_9PSED|nr:MULTISPECIES: UPF0158 family protein [Pseudomonas]OEC36892.1 hypothetical protein A7D25_03235 [Pseudomonas sp. 21C1]SEQ10023.1 Uncharacterised protein family (UPF0158) [Pseudomonas cuatrocienegasensis]
MLTLDLPAVIAALDGQQRLEHYLDLDSGQVIRLSPDDSDSEQRLELDNDPARFVAIEPLDTDEQVAMRAAFLQTLDDPHAHPLLAATLKGRKPLRRFDFELAQFPAAAQAWQAFADKYRHTHALAWLDELGLEPASHAATIDTRGIPKDILRRLHKGA